MNPLSSMASTIDGGAVSTAQRNRVLRNTYWLLALSMIPTVLGAWVGLKTGLVQGLGIGMSLVVFLVGALGLMYLVEKNKNSARGVPILLGFTFFMGLMLSRLLAMILSKNNGADLIMLAFGGTAATFAGMAVMSSVIKRDLSGMGRFLFIGMILAIVAMVANWFLQSGALAITLSALMIGIMSAFILYDLKRVRDGEETNYISATMSVYISVFSIFQNLLALLGIGNSD